MKANFHDYIGTIGLLLSITVAWQFSYLIHMHLCTLPTFNHSCQSEKGCSSQHPENVHPHLRKSDTCLQIQECLDSAIPQENFLLLVEACEVIGFL